MTTASSRPASSLSSFSPVPSTSSVSKQPKTLFDHLSTLAALVPRSFDLNYPMYTYAHSDDAVPRLHQRSDSGSSSSSSSSLSSSGLLTPPPASPLLAANRKDHDSIDDELDFGPPQGPAPAAWPSPELDLVRLPPPPARPEPSHKATPARKQLPVAKSKSKSFTASALQLLPTTSPALTRQTEASARVPSREAEEESRGRSRWPRLLWSSALDDESLAVLRSYHERAVGGPLPLLERGRGERGVREWSAKLEKAGL